MFVEFYTHLPAYEDGTECSETSAYKLQTPGNYPKESIQQVVFPQCIYACPLGNTHSVSVALFQC